jgi:hypothetical protein
MHAFSTLVVYSHLETMRAEAAARRMFEIGRPSLRARIAARLAALRRSAAAQVDAAHPAFPAVKNYPYSN